MTRLRSVFHFAVQGLLVAREALGSNVRFERDGYTVEIRIPADAKEFFPQWDHFPAVGGNWQGVVGGPHQMVNVLILQVSVVGNGPVNAKDFEGPQQEWPVDPGINYFEKTFGVVERVATEFVDWTRVRGQAWLALHGQRPERIGIDSLSDVEVGKRLPVGFHRLDTIHVRPPAAAVEPTFLASMHDFLGDERPPLPLPDTLLADALHFASMVPPDLQRAVLVAAIACEVMVKQTMRQKVAPDQVRLIDVILDNAREVSPQAAALFDKPMDAALGRSLRKENKALYKRIVKLFELRNGIAHRGTTPEEAAARDVISAAKSVFDWLTALPSRPS